ncbi:MAG: hypothetical protein NWQ87_01855 [Litorivicinaceae bacterium]|jgi:hypothetical protein|nr:hypothetical protein [Litorivicinaceae bacterium]
MPIAQAHSRLRESLSKSRALLALAEQSSARLDQHALDEAILHQIGATVVALCQTVAESHGISASTVQGLTSLQSALRARQLISVEAEVLAQQASAVDGWWGHWQNELERVMQPKPLAKTAPAYGLIGSDRSDSATSTNTAAREAHYRPWIEALAELIQTLEYSLLEA